MGYAQDTRMWLTYPLNSHTKAHKQLSHSHNTLCISHNECALWVFVILQEIEHRCSVNKQKPIQFDIVNVINVTVMNCFRRTSVLSRVLWTWTSLTSFSDVFLLCRREVGSYTSQNPLCMVPREIIWWEALMWGHGKTETIILHRQKWTDARRSIKFKHLPDTLFDNCLYCAIGWNSWREHLIDSWVL